MEKTMYVTGAGRTKFGPLKQTIPELLYEAMYKAVEDSSMDAKEIEAVYVGNFCAGPFQNQLHMNSLVAGLLPANDIPIIRVESACASASLALHQALKDLSRYSKILVVGVEKMTGVDGKKASEYISSAGDVLLDQSQGLIFPASYALIAAQHMRKYGTTTDDLALVSLKNHENANLNELAHFYHKKVTLEMIMNSPVVCTPLRLFDCSPISDGAAALVISNEKSTDRDVELSASQLATDTLSLSQRKDLTTFKATKKAGKLALEQAGITQKDVDLVQVHDCFTIAELVALEDLGFAQPGKAAEMVREGRTKLDGDLPVNTDGGLKGDGHPIGATGIAEVYELVVQLRGEAGKRQVDGAKVGLAQNIGGVGGTALVHILGRPD
ncbi:MAG: thiolase domain-containing protein [Candidatus Altiarchaeota archaeon]